MLLCWHLEEERVLGRPPAASHPARARRAGSAAAQRPAARSTYKQTYSPLTAHAAGGRARAAAQAALARARGRPGVGGAAVERPPRLRQREGRRVAWRGERAGEVARQRQGRRRQLASAGLNPLG